MGSFVAASGVVLGLALLLSDPAPAAAQTAPDSLRIPAAVVPPDSAAAPVGLAPDAPVAPLRPRTRWLIVGVCALITVSTLLLYNVRSR